MLLDGEDDEDDTWGFYEGQCLGCDLWGRIDDVGLCRECAAKLDRDLIRQRDWDYAPSAFGVPEDRREELRRHAIKQYGEKLELIAPYGTTPPRHSRRRRKAHGAKPAGDHARDHEDHT